MLQCIQCNHPKKWFFVRVGLFICQQSETPIFSALANYTTCYTNVYTKYCGKIGGYIGCNLVKAGALEDVPSCASQLPTCSKNFEAHKLFGMRQKFAAKRLAQKNHNNVDASKIH